MTRHLAWIGVAWFGVIVLSALGQTLPNGYVLPEFVVLVAAFLAFVREPIPLVASCLAMGYLAGRHALAPVGLHELALAGTALSIHLMVGSIAGGGRLFFAGVVGVATMIYHLTLAGLLFTFRGPVAFSSWPSALLFPAAGLTAFLAIVLQPSFMALENRLAPQQRQSLSF